MLYALEPSVLALYRPSAQHEAARLEAALLPRLHALIATLLRHAPPRWAQPLLHSVLANLCLALEGTLQLPERRFTRADLPLLQADVARLGAFFEADIRDLDGGDIDSEVVSSNIKYLYQLAEDSCEEGESRLDARAPPPKPSAGWWERK